MKRPLNIWTPEEIRTYYTDFCENILLNREDVVVTPHIGGSTLEAEANGATQGANTIMTYLETGNIENVSQPPQSPSAV
jgi:D-3-phosphoglycerate dehydrogenase / 2-oxoglutarate reductase